MLEKRGPLYTVGENESCFSHCGKQCGGSSKKQKIELPYDPAIPLVGIIPKENKTLIQKDTCTSMFIATLFTIAKTGKLPKCKYQWMAKEDVVHIYTVEHYSNIKKNEILPFATTWMDLEGIMLSEISQTDKYSMLSHISGIWNIKLVHIIEID